MPGTSPAERLKKTKEKREHCESANSAATVPLKKRFYTKLADPNTEASVSRCLPGFNIQWPFSELLLAGAKTVEVRSYDLDKHWWGKAGVEYWIVQTTTVQGMGYCRRL